MLDFLLNLFTIYVKVFAIIDPFAAIPTYLTLTEDFDERRRNEIIRKAFIAMTFMVIVFTLMGVWILNFFGITINSLRVAGGSILVVLAFDMLGEAPRSKKLEPGEIAVMPIATPLLVGPGTMTTIILSTLENPSISGYLIVLTASLMAVATATIILKYSEFLVKKLSKSFIKGLGRFMTIIIAATGFEMIKAGVMGWLSG